MNYCRKLAFTEDPDYKYLIGLFEGCMKKNGYDPRLPDFIWNKNRLVLEKEEIIRGLMIFFETIDILESINFH